jgi:AmmeMemoRadiSam system protein B
MKVREAAVAGSFYTGDKEELKTEIQQYLKNVNSNQEFQNIDGIISPHAGYIFSGPIAAEGFQTISKLTPKTVIILAPSHREYFDHFTIFPGEYYSTPLGTLKLSKPSINKLLKNKNIVESLNGHKSEHSLEVQLPFLQTIYSHDFQIVPIVIGDVNITQLDSLAQSLYELSKEENFLIIASSDLSHFHSYELANQIDNDFLDLVKAYDIEQIGEGFMDNTLEACGITSIYTLMKYVSLKGKAKCDILDYRNSGDTAGDKYRVVGYAAGVVYGE